jgi:hypothetical protein
MRPGSLAIQVFGLTSLGIAQPLLDLLRRNPEFFIARRSHPVDIFLLPIILCVVVPALLFLLILLARKINPRLGEIVRYCTIAILLFLALMPLFKHFETIPFWISIPATAAIATCITILSNKGIVRTFLLFLIPAVVIVPSLFLFSSGIQKLLSRNVSSPAPFVKIQADAPVIMIVLDELPTASLMDTNQNIDAGLFPNFARIQQQSTWFRKATTVADDTIRSVPAILTGRYPDSPLLDESDYQQNAFTLLQGAYDLRVFESGTDLCRSSSSLKISSRLESLFTDLSIIYLHLLLPRDLENRLPPILQTWGNFLEGSRESIRNNDSGSVSFRVHHFQAFLDSIRPSSSPRFYFLHILLPHVPWQYLPSGKEYDFLGSGSMGVDGLKGENWQAEEWSVGRGYQRHLLQLCFLDNLLGKMLDRLQQMNLLDRSILIVTADHGVSFRAGDSRRRLTKSNYEDLVFVPLFIKSPFQKKGAIVDTEAETTDILPTLADLLDIEVPWKVAGSSLFAEHKNERTRKKVFEVETKQWFEFDVPQKPFERTLEQKQSLFGRGMVEGLFQMGPRRNLIGKSIAESISEGGREITVKVNYAADFENIDPKSRYVPAFITGKLEPSENSGGHYDLAIAVNGTIRATTKSFTIKNDEAFGALLPEWSFQAGRNNLKFFVFPESTAELRASE